MKLIFKDIDRHGEGSIKLTATEEEDMWHLYNLITVGCRVKATTIRKVQRESATGSSESERRKITLEIVVDDVDFDAPGLQLRLKGRNILENEHVKIGAFHTIEIELNRPFVVTKKLWDEIDLERIHTACEPSAGADVAAIVMQEGLAHVFTLSNSLSTVCARIETNIPRKGINSVMNRDKAMDKFFEQLYRAMLEKLDFEKLKVIILASPGFVKDQFFKFAMDEANRRDDRLVIKARSSFILAHSSSGHKLAVQEVLSNPSLASRLADTKAVKEVQALNHFFEMLNNTPDRAVYGPQHVAYAIEMGAVQTLLITDSLFRNVDVLTRKKYVSFVDTVRSTGGDTHIFSAMHVTGEQLNEMTGVAAILRFPLQGLDEMDFDEKEPDDDV